VNSEKCVLGLCPSEANTVRLSSNISTALGGLCLYSSGFNRQRTANRTVLHQLPLTCIGEILQKRDRSVLQQKPVICYKSVCTQARTQLLLDFNEDIGFKEQFEL
jgi:hypothetical protein